jgi:hypothetical protein
VDEIQGKDGEWVPATELMGCCDCGLVHQMEYKLVDEYGVDVSNLIDVRLMIRSIRDRELTQKARETKNFVCSIKSNGGKNESV